MSETPRTDAIVYGRLCYVDPAINMKIMQAFSRQLERELAEAKQRIVECEMVMAHRYRIIERQEPRFIEANARENALRAELASAKAFIAELRCDLESETAWAKQYFEQWQADKKDRDTLRAQLAAKDAEIASAKIVLKRFQDELLKEGKHECFASCAFFAAKDKEASK
jgi:chromosome segregation ATPase